MSKHPENIEEFRELAATSGRVFLKCIICSNPFTQANVMTAAGWRETQISGFCEECYDSLFKDDEDDEDDSEE
jgi:hypothetical protein